MTYVYSDSLEEMVIKSFWYNGHKYIWNDYDLVYYEESTEEGYFTSIPKGALIN